MIARAVLLIITCAIPPAAIAQSTWYVDDNALSDPGPGDTAVSDPAEDGTAGHPFDAIQEALDAALAGDTVLLRDGTYTGLGNIKLNFAGKDLTLISQNGPAACIIDGQDDGPLLVFASGETPASVVQGLTLRNGRRRPVAQSDACGAGIYCVDASPTIFDCVIAENEVFDLDEAGDCFEGGGAYFQRSDARIIDCTFRENHGGSAGGEGLFIKQNGPGGGLFARGSNLLIEGCLFERNETGHGGDGGYGGAIGAFNSTLIVRNCGFLGNRGGDGGFRPVTSKLGAGASGAGLGGRNSTFTVENCWFQDNEAGAMGYDFIDGFFDDAGNGGAMWFEQCTVAVHNCRVIDNRAGDGRPNGGGGNGGGIALFESNATVINSLFAGNSAGRSDSGPLGRGGGIASEGPGATLTVINCTLAYNLPAGGAIHTDNALPTRGDGPSIPVLVNTIVRANAPVQIDGIVTATYSNIEGGRAGTGNIDADPHFRGPGGVDGNPATGFDGDYRPAYGAPGNDAADNTAVPTAATTDLDGGARFTDDPNAPDTGNGTAPLVDMGAYEANNGLPADCDEPFDPSLDCNGNGINDGCDIYTVDSDCDGNLVPDTCDLANGATDCNGNGLHDSCEIADGTTADCDGNGVPDTCDVAAGTAEDCNANGIPDSCDIAAGVASDCNSNGVPDACDIAVGTSDDCNADGVPDECIAPERIALDFGSNADLFDVSIAGANYVIPDEEPVTLEAWVYPRSIAGEQTVISKRPNNYALRIVDGRVRFRFVSPASGLNDFTTTAVVVPAGQWTHLAAVHTFGDSTASLIYVNGQQVAATWDQGSGGSAPNTDPEQDLVIGRLPDAAAFNGLIDEVRVWNRRRSAARIAEYMPRPVPTGAVGLLAHFPFDENAGATTLERVRNADAGVNGPGWVRDHLCLPCVSDLDASGLVDLDDLAALLANFGAAAPPAEGDIDSDGFVGLSDLARVLADFGRFCD